MTRIRQEVRSATRQQPNFNPEILTTKFTNHRENQAIPKHFRLIHQVSAKMATIASAFVLFVTLVVSHFRLKGQNGSRNSTVSLTPQAVSKASIADPRTCWFASKSQ